MDEKKAPRTLRPEQIGVSEKFKSAAEVLRASKPYLESALESMDTAQPGEDSPVEVPAHIVRDLVIMLAAEVKRVDALAGGRVGGRPGGEFVQEDPGDGDWNPFNKVDFEFD